MMKPYTSERHTHDLLFVSLYTIFVFVLGLPAIAVDQQRRAVWNPLGGVTGGSSALGNDQVLVYPRPRPDVALLFYSDTANLYQWLTPNSQAILSNNVSLLWESHLCAGGPPSVPGRQVNGFVGGRNTYRFLCLFVQVLE